MKRVLWIVCITVFAAVPVVAQDFVSKYMSENKHDTLLHCVSVSPKMMEEAWKSDAEKEGQEEMRRIMADLKSLRMISASANGRAYFDKAEQLAEKNRNRFEPFLAFDDTDESCRIIVRRKKKIIIELVMFSCKEESFRVINFTGNMNDTFIDNLAKRMMPEEDDGN